MLAVTATGREAEDLAAALRSLLPPDGVVEYPSWETLPHERLSPRSDTVGRRLAVLRRLAHPRADDPAAGPVRCVVAPVRSVLQPQVKGLGDLEPVALRPGQTADLDEVADALAAAAYARVELVEKRGEFAVRGGILDVFPPTEEHPLRVEFWGDDVEEIRYFKVADQRSLEIAEHGLWAPPCRELLLTDEVRERAAALAEAHPELGELLDKIAEGIAVEGMESLAPVLVDDMELLLDVLPAGVDGGGLRPGAGPDPGGRPGGHQPGVPAGLLGGHRRRAARRPIDVGAASLWGIADVRDRARELGMMWWSVSPVRRRRGATPRPLTRRRHPQAGHARPRDATAATPRGRSPTPRAGSPTAGAPLRHRGPRPRRPHRRGARRRGHRGPAGRRPRPSVDPSVVHVSCGSLDYGFVDPALKLAVLTETDLSGQKAVHQGPGPDAGRGAARPSTR